MKKIGALRRKSSLEIPSSHVSIGFECVDRKLIRPEMCYDLIGESGIKWARMQTGWARTESQKGMTKAAAIGQRLTRSLKSAFTLRRNSNAASAQISPSIAPKTHSGAQRQAATSRGKPTAAVSVCRRGGSTASYQCMNMPFEMLNCPMVTSQYWNIVFGREEGECERDTEGMQTMRTLGRNMAWLLKNLKRGDAVPRPAPEPWQPMHFIR